MKKLYSLFVFILMMGMMMLTHSCFSDDLTTGIAQQEETKGWHTAKVKFSVQCSPFDAQRDARAETLTWQEGDVVWILLTDKDGKKVPAYVQYTAGEWGEVHWEGYKSQITCENPRTAEAYFIEGVNNPNQTQVGIDAGKAIYACTTGTYQYPDGGDMMVTVSLSPVTGRIRFTGNADQTAKVFGIKTCSAFNPATGEFTASTAAVSTTVNSTGSTPYLYAVFADAETPTLIIETDNTFKTLFEATTPVLQMGKSGYMSLPTVSDHRGWVTIVPVTGVQLDKTELTIDPGQTAVLNATVLPSNATEQEIVWTSSDTSVATVSNGTVTAKADGTATITATSVEDKSKKASCKVTVSFDRVYTANGVSFTMKYVAPGTFQMGSDTGDSDEKPVHSVTISKGYYIGETEVTQALWKAVTGNSPTTSSNYSWSSTYGLGDNFPAYYISYEDVESFIKQLNSLTGAEFRMPTEAEWEFAARGGNKSKGYEYSGSDTAGDVAWSADNSGNQAHPVKTKAPNELGLYDMSGNVQEWCSDWYGSYSSSAVTDPTGASTGSERVRRGGGWNKYADYCRSAYRSYSVPSSHYSNGGVRLACSAVLQ